ncbi:MAG: hypothetical protein ACLQVF_39035 [Isosphaeraceae bacterium]
MTNEQRITLLRHTLKGMLALVDEGYTGEAWPDEPRIVEARRAFALTDPALIEREPTASPLDYTDMRNRSVVGLKHVSKGTEIVDHIDETSAKGTITESEAGESRVVAGFLGHRAADAPVLTLFETQVIDECGDYSSRRFAWTRAEALSAAASRAQELISEGNRDPSNVHPGGVDMHAIAFTRDGILEFLNDHIGYLF